MESQRRGTKEHWVFVPNVENLREKLRWNFPGRQQTENKPVTMVSK